MPASAPSASKPWVAIFDLDGTLTWRDTLLPFLTGYLKLHPPRFLGLWRLVPALLGFVVLDRDRGILKSRLIRMVMGGDSRAQIDTWVSAYVNALKPACRFRAEALAALEAHRQAGDHLVLLSASPDVYVPSIGRLLGFERTLCTEIEWRGDRLDGALMTPNRHGQEKSRCVEWLRDQYPGLPFIAYGNSASDLDHMRTIDRAILVNGNAAARRMASREGIPTADWR
jgi:phosphatidylglycerophosphatase C